MSRQEKITKKFFFDLIESRIKRVEEDAKKWKEKEKAEGYTHEVSYSRSGIHARLGELDMLVFETRYINYDKYIELTQRINEIRDSM